MDHPARRQRLIAALESAGLDSCLVTVPVNVTYLTGLTSSNAAVLVTAEGQTLLATDDRYAEAATAICPDAEVITARSVAAALADRAAASSHRIGIEHHHVTLAVHDEIMAVVDANGRGVCEVVDLDQAVETLRSVKDAAEVARVAQACALSVQALTDLLESGLDGRSERQIARQLEARMLMLGADGLAFDTIVASGPNGSVPHHSPSDRTVGAGDFVTIDFGATVDGYHADCTRTVLVGAPAASWQQEIYELVATAQRAGVAALAPGRSTGEIDAAARTVIAEAGYEDYFVHGLGHGVGLQIHEPPWLMSNTQRAGTLGSRTTVTVEPGIYLPGTGGVRIEDTTDVGPDGVRVLTDLTTDLITL